MKNTAWFIIFFTPEVNEQNYYHVFDVILQYENLSNLGNAHSSGLIHATHRQSSASPMLHRFATNCIVGFRKIERHWYIKQLIVIYHNCQESISHYSFTAYLNYTEISHQLFLLRTLWL